MSIGIPQVPHGITWNHTEQVNQRLLGGVFQRCERRADGNLH